jgi:hypothetical protein
MDIIVVQSEGAVKFLALKLIFLQVFVVPFGHVREKGADIANHAAVWVVMGHLLNGAIAVYDHAVIAHIVLNVVMPSVDGVIAE